MTTRLSEKERQIAAAALRVFTRYGLKRTTMSDVAEEAGVVRQTLYNVFANKDEVIHGTLLYYTEMLRKTTLDAWKGESDLSIKLDLLFEHYIVASWDAVRATPDAGDLESGSHAAAERAMVAAEAALDNMLADLFAPHADALARNGQNVADFAPFVRAVLMGFKHKTRDRDALLKNLAAFKALVVLSTT
ncbi:TetR/AcrR family transcriptional regulator [Gymnodinialimonas sp. 57CJ19]|uniref:TetR/AcrR family transcriptional regulator n=1 Tax=Gymnodinialimonas sp. 57CJ19 TaxID=3138498 RepID=UPI0031342C38